MTIFCFKSPSSASHHINRVDNASGQVERSFFEPTTYSGERPLRQH